jgi:hypothetical protein
MDYASAKDLLEEHASKIRNGHGVVAKLDPLCKRLANETELSTSAIQFCTFGRGITSPSPIMAGSQVLRTRD